MSAAAPTTPVPAPAISRGRALLLAARPRTLPAAASPVVVGSAVCVAEGGFRLGPALAALFGALMIQVGTNYANDVADFLKGTDTHERVGPLRVTQAGLLSPRAVGVGAAVAFALATLAGDATLLFYLTEEAKEGKQAFIEKRKPDFRKFPRLP